MRRVELRRGSYVDSVTLMQVSRRVSGVEGVESAMVAMATGLNLDLAQGMGFEVPESSPDEMLVAVSARSEAALSAALAEVDAALGEVARPARGGFGSAPPPVTVRSAAARSDATVALVSTPGTYAFADAIDAVEAGLHTMVFSDNVPVEQEVALKDRAEQAGVLVMGPDCGTAVVGGVGLGFANVVRPGPVGLVAASGTGAQHLMSLLDGADVGVSHCLGVGGRDLSAAVAGRSTIRALDLLDADPTTSLVVVVSKPPAPGVAEAVRAHAASLATPVLFGLLGAGQPDLTETAAAVVAEAGGTWAAPEHWSGAVVQGRSGPLRGLFVGGTLCDEAMLVASTTLGRIASNIPLQPDWSLGEDLASGPEGGHTMIDFGDDRLTQGRPHPMIDGALRVERLEREVDEAGVLLLDVVLGLGATADPADELAPGIRRATAAGVPVVVSVIGTRDDPQGLRQQVATLSDAGAWVFRSSAAAARQAVALLDGSPG